MMLDSRTLPYYSLSMARTASPAAVSPVLALDADGDEFVMDFGFPTVSTARPAVAAPAVDSVEARLERERVAAGFRLDWHADRGLLPR